MTVSKRNSVEVELFFEVSKGGGLTIDAYLATDSNRGALIEHIKQNGPLIIHLGKITF